jgi:iron(III) transport system substrate-binding protein
MRKSKKIICVLVLTILVPTLFWSFGQKEEESNILYVYSVINDKETEALTQLFTEKTGIQVQYLRSATGELINRVIAEQDSPQADVLLGGPSSLHMVAYNKGALEKYISSEVKNFPSYTYDENGCWTGFCVLSLGIGINTTRFSEKYPLISLPKTWDDLVNPAFNQEIVLTDPLASSTAYLFVQNQLQRLGWNSGWDYLQKLSQLVGQFPSSGGAPPKLVVTGEYTMGVAYLHALTKYVEQGFPVTIIAPPESVGEVDAVSIIKNCKNKKNAEKFVDFMVSIEAQTLFSSMSYTIPVNPKVENPSISLGIQDIDLLEYDDTLAASQRDSVLIKWQEIIK